MNKANSSTNQRLSKFYEANSEIPGITEKGTSREAGTIGTTESEVGVKSGFSLPTRLKKKVQRSRSNSKSVHSSNGS